MRRDFGFDVAGCSRPEALAPRTYGHERANDPLGPPSVRRSSGAGRGLTHVVEGTPSVPPGAPRWRDVGTA